MDIQLIQLYVLVCTVYDTRGQQCFQRTSHNPDVGRITDQEIITLYWFGHLHGRWEKKAMHHFIQGYWLHYFPKLPTYQTWVARRTRLEASFHTLGAYLQAQLPAVPAPEIDQLIDSLPVMLARGGHAYTAKVAPEVADVGYCASKKQYFHGVRLHTVAQRRSGKLPCPQQIWLREGSCHDVRSVKEQQLALPTTTLIGDSAYADAQFRAQLAAQGTTLQTPHKKPKGKQLSLLEKHPNRCVSRLRQPVEGLFHWFNDQTGLQDAGTVRSEDALLVHCFGKLAFAYFLLVFYP